MTMTMTKNEGRRTKDEGRSDYDLGGYKKGPPRIFTDGREAWYMVNYKEKIIFRGCRNGGGVPGIPTLSG